jgi:hypothetical protein
MSSRGFSGLASLERSRSKCQVRLVRDPALESSDQGRGRPKGRERAVSPGWVWARWQPGGGIYAVARWILWIPLARSARSPSERTHLCSARRGVPRVCLARAAELTAIEEVDRAKAAHEVAAGLLDDSRRSRAERRRQRSGNGACPLCGDPATIVDWRPSVDWVVVEDCPCDGFFIRAGLLDSRVPTLPDDER